MTEPASDRLTERHKAAFDEGWSKGASGRIGATEAWEQSIARRELKRHASEASELSNLGLYAILFLAFAAAAGLGYLAACVCRAGQ